MANTVKDFDARKTTLSSEAENSFNDNLTALPKDPTSIDQASADADLAAGPMDYGEMNLNDAKESGYTDENGKAVDTAEHSVEGSPTGAYTDVGAGRSSAITRQGSRQQPQARR